MNFLLSFSSWLGGAVAWLIKDFAPMIAKRLGLGAILGVVQKTVSFAVIAFIIAFFGMVINFVLSIFSAFSNFLNYLSDISSNGGTWGSCFVYMLNVSGISAGIQMALPFYFSVISFFFLYAAYKIAFVVFKTVSDETSKTIESVK